MSEPSDDFVMIDLPWFGTADDWRRCAAELATMPRTDEVLEAEQICAERLAELLGAPAPTLAERMNTDLGITFTDD